MATVKNLFAWALALSVVAVLVLLAGVVVNATVSATSARGTAVTTGPTLRNAKRLIARGRRVFRFETFGDQAVWGGVLGLHRAIEGAKNGGVGPGVSPKTALKLGLKVDAGAIPKRTAAAIKAGKVNLNDPKTTLALLKLNAVVGVRGDLDPLVAGPLDLGAGSLEVVALRDLASRL